MLKRGLLIGGLGVLTLVFSAGASNITIADGRVSPQPGYLWDASWMATTNEDNEVEPGCETGQKWDLEAFLLNGSNLTVVAGYDLKNGYDGTVAGDLFVDVDGKSGYDYVYNIDWKNGTYNLYQINSTGTVNIITMSPENTLNASSNPLSYTPGVGQTALASGSLNYQSGIASGTALVNATGDAAAGTLIGDATDNNHNIATVDVSRFDGMNATFHLTMSCGNDNMMGKALVNVPEPGVLSMVLMGLLSLSGFVVSRRRN